TAASISPLVSPRAALQSIMPAPVRSRSSLTICAVILAIETYPSGVVAGLGHSRPGCDVELSKQGARPGSRARRSFRGQFLRLSDPAIHTAGQSNLLADLVGRLGPEARDLPIMENAKIVELLLDGGRDMRELLEIVGDAPRPGEHFIARSLRRGRELFHDRLGGRADVDAHLALRARDA